MGMGRVGEVGKWGWRQGSGNRRRESRNGKRWLTYVVCMEAMAQIWLVLS